MFTEKVVGSPSVKFSLPHSQHHWADFVSLVTPRCWLGGPSPGWIKSQVSVMVSDVDSLPHYSLSECQFSNYNCTFKKIAWQIFFPPPLSLSFLFPHLFSFIYFSPTRILTRVKTIEMCESDVNSSPDISSGSSHNNEPRKREGCVGRLCPGCQSRPETENATKKQYPWISWKRPTSRIWLHRICIIISLKELYWAPIC